MSKFVQSESFSAILKDGVSVASIPVTGFAGSTRVFGGFGPGFFGMIVFRQVQMQFFGVIRLQPPGAGVVLPERIAPLSQAATTLHGDGGGVAMLAAIACDASVFKHCVCCGWGSGENRGRVGAL